MSRSGFSFSSAPMIGLLRRKSAKRAQLRLTLGHLELRVMEILWARGESNVRDVAQQVERPLAYTTVMTTLDRLYKKGLLSRRKSERAFLYLPVLSRDEWQQKRTGDWLAGVLTGPGPSGELLISCLVDAFSQHDAALLDELERKIRLKRKQLSEERQA